MREPAEGCITGWLPVLLKEQLFTILVTTFSLEFIVGCAAGSLLFVSNQLLYLLLAYLSMYILQT